MQLYPAIDLKDGKCVRLIQGDYKAVTIYNDQPIEVAKEWERMGASYLHLVDLDGAKEGKSMNDDVIGQIVKAVNIPVQVGGGIRTLDDIKKKLDLGVDRVILGSVAVANPDRVASAIQAFGSSHIVVGIDAKDGKVAVEGWYQVSDEEAVDFALKMKAIGVETVVYTDIAKDGMMQGPNIVMTQKLIQETGLQVIASGGVRSLADLEEVQEIAAQGAIIGKALYIGAIALDEAIRLFEGDDYAK